MRRDILSAYAASISRVMSWVIVSAIVYRRSHEAFAMLALVRGTIGILNYASLGLMPAMIRALVTAQQFPDSAAVVAPVTIAALDRPFKLDYVTPQTTLASLSRPSPDAQRIYATGFDIGCLASLVGTVAIVGCVIFSDRLYAIPYGFHHGEVDQLFAYMGFGIILRGLTEPAGALLQTRDQIALDNVILVTTEVMWVLLTLAFLQHGTYSNGLRETGSAFLLSGLVLLFGRFFAPGIAQIRRFSRPDRRLFRPLLTTGLLITLAQLADYLYSPTDYLLINHLLTPLDLTHYAPAVQIDSGLLLLVTALGSVLLPKTALAHAAGDRAIVRTYYLRGTLASAVTLITASLVIYFASPLIFRLWFGNAMPGTVAILPLVLLNTVIGGSSAVGRAILIGIGKTKPFAISVLMAGVTNVVFSVIFVRYFQMGLNGIILGTIVAVVVRCGIWMPWYVLRELDRGGRGVNGLRVG